jgi:hypothetical protein
MRMRGKTLKMEGVLLDLKFQAMQCEFGFSSRVFVSSIAGPPCLSIAFAAAPR